MDYVICVLVGLAVGWLIWGPKPVEWSSWCTQDPLHDWSDLDD